MPRPKLTSLFLIVLSCHTVAFALRAEEPPNILLILADDMGFSDAGCYGGEIETPHLDKLAAGGLRFTQCYNTGRCWPTRASLMTGYYPQQVRRDALPDLPGGGQGVRPPWAELLPKMLGDRYRSYHSGKWHIDGEKLPSGFARSYSLEDHDRNFSPKWHFEDDKPLAPVAADASYYTSTAISNHAIDCLAEHAASHAGVPFFQYLCFTSPHFPLQAPAADIKHYSKRYEEGWNALRKSRGQRVIDLGICSHFPPPFEPDVGPPYHFPDALAALGLGEVNRPLPWADLEPDQHAFQSAKMAIHAAMVTIMDREIGRVIAQIEKMGELDNTLVLFLSDNGASAEMMVRGDGHDPSASPGSAASFLCLGPGWSTVCNTPFRRHKTWVHEGGISTPLIVHWPIGISDKGKLRTQPAHVVDIVPTLLDVTGIKRESPQGAPAFPGRSLAGVMKEDAVVSRDAIWWLHEGNRAIRVGDLKLVADKGAPWELYDLAQDRGETNNLASAQPDTVKELEEKWTSLTRQFKGDATRSP